MTKTPNRWVLVKLPESKDHPMSTNNQFSILLWTSTYCTIQYVCMYVEYLLSENIQEVLRVCPLPRMN